MLRPCPYARIITRLTPAPVAALLSVPVKEPARLDRGEKNINKAAAAKPAPETHFRKSLHVINRSLTNPAEPVKYGAIQRYYSVKIETIGVIANT